MMGEEVKNNKKIIAIVLSILAILLLVGGSYAVFYYNFVGEKNIIETAQVQLELLESDTNVIGITNALPSFDKQGVDQEETFDFAVTSNTSETTDINYEIYLEELAITSGYTKFDSSEIRVYLEDYDGNIVTGPLLISDLSNMVLHREEHNHNKDTVKIQDKYKLRVWIDDEVDAALWDEDEKYEYKFKIGVRTTDYVTPEECFDVTGGGMIVDYRCGNTTAGAEKHYDLVIPKTFSYGYTTLNQTDKTNIISSGVSETAVNQAITEAETGNYENFDLMVSGFIKGGGKLTTEKEPIGYTYTYLNEQDDRNMRNWAKTALGMSEEKVNELADTWISAANNGDYDSLNEAIDMYVEAGGTVTTEKTHVGVKPLVIGFYAFRDEGLKTVYMPDSITNTYWSCFSNNQIVKVKLSNSLESLSECDFCSNKLTSIVLPNSYISAPMDPFYNNDLRIIQIGTSTDSNVLSIMAVKSQTSNSKLFRVVNKSGAELDFGIALGASGDYYMSSGIVKHPYGDVEVTLE